MCTDGVNSDQFKSSIEQIDEAIALCRRWVHRAHHQAEDGSLPKTSDKLLAAQGLLDDIRALLEEAQELVERESADKASVQVV